MGRFGGNPAQPQAPAALEGMVTVVQYEVAVIFFVVNSGVCETASKTL